MREVTKNQVIACLEEIGVQPGDGLLTHSAIQFLGRPIGGAGMYMEAIMEVIGPQGTLVVPTFNFGFARGEPYDPEETPSQGMGAFSEYVRQRPQARRTSHPMQSVSVIGYYAADLAERDTPSAFDPGSAFERMLALDFKLLLLGAHVSATSIYHISEQHNRVPYRYWKDFSGLVRSPSGWEERAYRMYVRDLDLDPKTTADPVQERMEANDQWRSVALNYGRIATCRLKDFVATVDHFLTRDPWSLVTNRPESAQ